MGCPLHWANDAVGQLVQMRLALKPDGLMIAVFFSAGRGLHELRTAFYLGREPDLRWRSSPRVVPMAEIRDGGGVAANGLGLALPVADTLRLDLSYENAFGFDVRTASDG